MERLIPLGDARARDPEVAGDKAAELARAAAAEMPVLPGWVLPFGESAAAIAAARSGSGSPAAAVLAVSSVGLDPGLRHELGEAVRALGGHVVVRSSSPLEGDARWAGAFASYLDVGAGEIEAAVRGCWASAFTRDAQARAAHVGVDPAGLAVLIQPWVPFASGGAAARAPDGSIRLSVASGSPADLLSGRASGVTLRLDAGAPLEDASLPDGVSAPTARAALELARKVAALGDDAIEWGASCDGRVTLLQARRAAPAEPVATVVAPRRRRYPPVAERLATAAATYPGRLAERWVFPWALAVDALPPAEPLDVRHVAGAVDEAAALAADLTAFVWGLPRGRLAEEVGPSFRTLLGPEPSAELARLSTLGPPEPARAARLLGLLEGVGARLHADGSLGSPDDVWRVSPEELRAVVRGRAVAIRRGADRWEPFVFSVVRDRGRTFAGRAASPGLGAGRAVAIGASVDTSPPPRSVLIVRTVTPQLASLLWGAAGLVARSGSEGAHLFEVARSLGVPAILGVELDPRSEMIVAVDGARGTVSVSSLAWRLDRSPPGRSSLERRTA
jgi:phosphohistidine swiveling domain-containing protein